jgi:hypothetical protein
MQSKIPAPGHGFIHLVFSLVKVNVEVEVHSMNA